MLKTNATTSPPTITIAKGRCASEPIPCDTAAGNNPRRVSLTQRETGVLRFLVQGLANKEIAARMDISESAVQNTFQQLFAKIGARNRSQLVRAALEQYRDLL